MTVWMVAPSAAPVEQAARCFAEWREMDYMVAVAIEGSKHLPADMELHLDHYDGYANAVNLLARTVLASDDTCHIIVAAADDVYPDQGHEAHVLSDQFSKHFGGTLGVMQPSGHSSWSRNADLIAWSPWLGREFCARANLGNGPLWPGYWHGWADRELRVVAERAGIFWDRPDLRQHHDAWHKRRPKIRPAHLRHVPAHTDADAALYREREAVGFPGAEFA